MHELLTTSDLITLIEKSRHSVNHQVPQIKEIKKKTKTKIWIKIIYIFFLLLAMMHLAYLTLPRFYSQNELMNMFDEQTIEVVKYGQTTTTVEITLVQVHSLSFSDLMVGDHIVIYNDTDLYYMEKEVISIDQNNETFHASYNGDTLETYDADELLGYVINDANFLQMYNFSVSSLRGYLGSIGIYVIIFGVTGMYTFRKTNKNEGSELDE